MTEGGGMAYKLGMRLIADPALTGAAALAQPSAYGTSKSMLLEALEPLPKEAGVFIKVHEGVPVGFAVAALQVARDAGFDQVTYVPVE